LTTPSEALADALKNLEGQVMESYVDGWKNYWKLVTDVARNPASLPAAQKQYLTHIAQTAPDRLSKTFQAGVQVCGALIQSSGQLANQIYAQTAQDLQKASTATTKAMLASHGGQTPPATLSEFTFEGFVDETLSRKFLVSNNSVQPVAVALHVTNFTPDPGDALLKIELNPETFYLTANEEKVVECRLAIPASLAPMTEFHATLSAPDVPSLNIRLNVKSLGPRDVFLEDIPTA